MDNLDEKDARWSLPFPEEEASQSCNVRFGRTSRVAAPCGERTADVCLSMGLGLIKT